MHAPSKITKKDIYLLCKSHFLCSDLIIFRGELIYRVEDDGYFQFGTLRDHLPKEIGARTKAPRTEAQRTKAPTDKSPMYKRPWLGYVSFCLLGVLSLGLSAVGLLSVGLSSGIHGNDRPIQVKSSP